MKYTLPKLNLWCIAISTIIIIAGFALMAGSPSGETYNPDIFSVRRITIGPMVALFGFVTLIVAILLPSEKKQDEADSMSEKKANTPKI